jgi:hypothetical protein
MEKNMNANQALPLRGKFFVEHRNKDGKLIGLYRIPNGIVDVGMNFLLDCMFNSGTQSATWYIGLIDNSGYTGVSDSDTNASHSGWTEFTGYSGGRKTWGSGAASSRSVSNGTTVDFTMTSAGGIRGIMVTDQASGTGAVLWATALFSSSITVAISDVLKITYTVSG